MVGARTEDDHRTAAGLLGVGRELSTDALGHGRRHAGDLLLPGRGVGRGVVVAGGPLAGQALATHAVLGQHEVEHGGHQPGATGGVDGCGRDTPVVHAAALAGLLVGVEPGQQHLGHLRARRAVERQRRVDALEVQVPLAHAGLVEPEAQRAVGHVRAAGRGIHHDGLELRPFARVAEVRGGEELVRDPRAVALLERHQERQVGVLLDVLHEARHGAFDEELLEHHVTHGHAQRAVGAGVRREPLVGELGVVRVVRRHHHDLLAAVPRLSHEVCVRGAGLGHVRAPHDQVGGVEPVGRLGHVGLVAEDLR